MNLFPVFLIALILFVIAVVLIIAEYYLVNYGECNIVINGEKVLAVQGGGNLLAYFSDNEIFIPSACGGKATCGHCKVKVLSGAGSILPTEKVYINSTEMDEGTRLACQVKIKNDVEVYIPEHVLETKIYNSEVEEICDLTHDIKQIKFRLKDPDSINFRPGQYIQIKIPGTDEYRAYSIASSPNQQDSLELTIRLVPGGLCSTYVHKAMEEGDKAVFTGPFGEFYLNENSAKNIICVAGGCGMAPVMSIILYLAKKGMPRKVIFFFGARSKRDLFYTDELRNLEAQFPNFKYVPALSEPRAVDKWDGEVGLITQVMEKYIGDSGKCGEYLAQKDDDINVLEAYLCGPPPMIDATIKVLNKKGMSENDIYYDKF